jgi:2,4-diaminopentanoate dehydrogenase
LIAKGLGWEIDEIRENFDRVATDRDLDVAFGTAKAGTCGAAAHASDRRGRRA